VESLLSFDSAQGENLSACIAEAAAEMLRSTNGSADGDWDAKLPQNSFVRRELQAASQP
jgi:hypothetical protein